MSVREISDRHVLLAMKRHGGSFVLRLGDAGLYADTDNLAAIKAAFPLLWKFYSETAKHELIKTLARELHRANFDQVEGCSAPGCGYPDGKPCIGCGRIVPIRSIFHNCNVCGCVLRGDSELAMGMCTAHANEGFLKL